MFRLAVLLVAVTFALPIGAAHAQATIRCESPNFQYRHCAATTGGRIQGAELRRQISSSPCVEGRTWGWDARGVWVTGGCSAVFGVFGGGGGGTWVPPAAGPGVSFVTCESRNYGHRFCATPGRVVSASIANQRSAAPCIQGRSWGWRADGIWVSNGCEADFRIRSDVGGFPPPASGLTVCESHEYRYNFCATGRVRSVQLVQQRSQAPCVQGRSWGWTRDGIWVDHGCEAAFRVR
jgi:hypothetical protein